MKISVMKRRGKYLLSDGAFYDAAIADAVLTSSAMV